MTSLRSFKRRKSGMVVFGVPSVSMRPYFSTYYPWAAMHFAKLAEQEETKSTKPFNIQERAYVTNCAISAVAFLEASINEVFDDIAEAHDSCIKPLSEETRELLAGLWTGTDNLERWSTREKYRIVLLCAGAPNFDKGAQPYQDANLLVRLRNRLVH
jgi:hypothetical protein